ncbi:hypothetical protein N4P33_08970 [Streptomyces sp. 15-116A]|uniref:hypothetical protein n=1 Tax=Streptomyces sp. 15-116A TaxID=2259035 RepID=UPI0021B453F3|nr:hypothetical protein [Streptomyces sp. 15-116A]MCT7352306.1 hypothetical protein [Streptomyces sp. 15-116A]
MSDLYIDSEMLQRVRENLAHIGTLLDKPSRAMDRVDSKAMGASELEKRMDSFGDEWKYGIDQLKKFSKSAVKALDKIEKAFGGLDAELAKALREAAQKK